MVREIVRDVIFLGQKSTDATIADIKTAMDLVDTLEANRNACVGMAVLRKELLPSTIMVSLS